MAKETICELSHNKGAIIISLFDIKDELEGAFVGLKPVAKYHLRLLNNMRDRNGNLATPQPKKIRIYHPLTKNILKKLEEEPYITPNKIPSPLQFYTLSVKTIDRELLYLVTEREKETKTIRLILQAVRELKQNEGMQDLKLKMQEIVKRKGLLKQTDYTPSNVGEANSLLEFLEYSYTFMPDNFELNLDFKRIFSDQEHYHIFTTLWLDDEKGKYVQRFQLLKEIRKNLKYIRYKLLLDLEEVRRLAPYRSEDYRSVLSSLMRGELSILRNKGEGVNTIMTTQVFKDLNESIRNSPTQTLMGRIEAIDDMHLLTKIYQFNKPTKDILSNLEAGKFLQKGKENIGVIKFNPPTHAHCETKSRFFLEYKRQFPDNYKSAKPYVEKHQEAIKEIKERVQQKINKILEEQRKATDKKLKQKELKEKEKEKIQEQQEQIKQQKEETRIEKIRKTIELYLSKDPQFKSFRKISKEVGLTHPTVSKYIKAKKMSEEGYKIHQTAPLLKLTEEQVQEILDIWKTFEKKEEDIEGQQT